jgi:O-antigen/teichoic acid export membrane protein
LIETSAEGPASEPTALPFGSHAKRLSRGVIIYGVTSALSRLSTLLLVPILTAYLTPADHGVLSLLTILTAILAPVLSVGLGAAAGACYFQGDSEQRKAATIWMSVVLITPGVVVLGAAAALVPGPISTLVFHTPAYARLVSLTLVSTACSVAALPFTLYLQLEERAAGYARVMLTSAAVSVIATLVGVVWLRLGVNGVVYATFVGQLALVVQLLAAVAVRLPRRFDRTVLRELAWLGVPLVPAVAFVFVLQHGNKFVLEREAGLDALGIYTVGFNLGLALSILVGAFQNAWLPFAMSFAERRQEAAGVFGRVLTYYVIAGGLVTVLFFVAARPAVMLLAAPRFHDAYLVVGLSAAAQFFSGMFSILLPTVYFARQVQSVTLMQGLAAAATMLLNIPLVAGLGVLGAGVGLAGGALLLVALQHAWNVSHRRQYLQVHYQWRRVTTALAVYAGIAAVTLWPRALRIGPELALAGAAALCAFAAAYLALSAPERAELVAALRQYIPAISMRPA